MFIFSNPPPFFSNFPYPLRLRAPSLLCTHVHPFGLYKRSYQTAHTRPPAPHPTLPARPPTRPRPPPLPPSQPPAPRGPARPATPTLPGPARPATPTPPGPPEPAPLSTPLKIVGTAGRACSRAARGRREGGASAACSGVRAAATAALRWCGGVQGEGKGGGGLGTVSSCVQRRAAALGRRDGGVRAAHRGASGACSGVRAALRQRGGSV